MHTPLYQQLIPLARRTRRPGSGLFDPTTVTGLQQWIDLTDATKVTQSSNVITAVADKSGLGNSMTSSAGSPTWVANAINSLHAASFSGSSQNLKGSFVCPTTFTLFIVFKQTTVSNGGGDRLFGGEDAASGANGIGLIGNFGGGNNTYLIARNAGTTADVTMNFSLINNAAPAWLVCDFSVGPGGVKTFVNGADAGHNTIITSITNGGFGFAIGSASATPSGTYYTGSYAEHLIYSGELGSTDRNNVRTNYLRAKFAI